MMEESVLSTLWVALAVVLGGVLLIFRLPRKYSSKAGASNVVQASLPEGSFGWPVVGETLVFAPDPVDFVRVRVKRYGTIFKSFLLMRPTIIGTTPEFAKFVASNNKIFKSSAPRHLAELIGPQSFMLQEGPAHMSVKKLVVKAVGVEVLRTQVSMLESTILNNIVSWEHAGTVNALDGAKELTWGISNRVLYGDKDSSHTPEGRKNFENLKKILGATLSLPVNLPGTNYAQGLKAKASLCKYFQQLIKQSSGITSSKGVFFEALLAAREDPEGREELKEFDDEKVADSMFLLNLAAFDTTSASLVWILKLLVENPDVFRRVQAEQQKILDSKDPSVGGPRLTWEDTRSMVYTHKFFQEVQRYVSLISVTVREATEDAVFGGYLIPKGWVVLTTLAYIHSDPANYPDLSFNPDRYDVTPKPYANIPFSAGVHMCPGMEMARLISLIFIHHLTTTYVFESAAPDAGVKYEGIMLMPVGGYPVRVSRRK